MPGDQQAERDRIAAAPGPLVFAMVVVVERVADEPLDPFGLRFTFEAIAHDPLFVHERFFIAFRVGAVAIRAAPRDSSIGGREAWLRLSARCFASRRSPDSCLQTACS